MARCRLFHMRAYFLRKPFFLIYPCLPVKQASITLRLRYLPAGPHSLIFRRQTVLPPIRPEFPPVPSSLVFPPSPPPLPPDCRQSSPPSPPGIFVRILSGFPSPCTGAAFLLLTLPLSHKPPLRFSWFSPLANHNLRFCENLRPIPYVRKS